MKYAIFLAGFALLGASAADASVKDGVDAWSRGDYAAAVAQWRPLAEKGDPDAEYNLAQAYKFGRGVDQDLAKAEELFEKAAAQGHLQAADNVGLLLFQRGEHAKAMPYLEASAGRGDPRAQYILGLAYFNGDGIEKDWTKAYALVSLAQQQGLPQAAPALSQMDQYIPLKQRQQGVALSTQLAAEARANRERQEAASDLGTGTPQVHSGAPATAAAAAPAPAAMPAVHKNTGPAAAGADFTRPRPALAAAAPASTPPSPPVAAPTPAAKPVATRASAAAPAPAKPATGGDWRVQLGAFGVAGNADALWNKVKSRPEISGHSKVLEPAGRLTKLLAGGFASRAEAQEACKRLSAAGFACIPVGK